MSWKGKSVCTRVLICLVAACLLIPSLDPAASGLGAAASAATASDQTFMISSGNYGWHLYGDTKGDPEEPASVNITMYFKNCDFPSLTFYIFDHNGNSIGINNSDYTVNSGRRYLQLKTSYLATLPIGNYRMDIYCNNGMVTAYFYILKFRDLIFIEQPQTVTIDEGENATFSVIVTGSSGYSYEWQRRSRTGWKTIKGATTRTMTLRSVPAYMTGYHYRCLVHSSAGDAYSDTARVFIVNAPATGDANTPLLYGACALLSMLGMVCCFLSSRRKRSRSAKE